MNTINHVTLNGVTKYIKDSAGQAMLAPEELTLTAANAHAVGDLFRYDGKLYKVSTAIEIGDTIEVGTNCEETTIAGENIKDVQINGTSVVTNGVANIQPQNGYGIGVDANDKSKIVLIEATDLELKGGGGHRALTGTNQHKAVFYGLAKASGDTTQSQSNNAVGTYTDDAKTAIKTMLGVQDGLKVVRLI